MPVAKRPNPEEQQFPNEAKLKGQVSEVHENNHFRDFPVEECRKRHINFSVLMHYVNAELDLPREATVEQFAHRIRDLIYAANRQVEEENND